MKNKTDSKTITHEELAKFVTSMNDKRDQAIMQHNFGLSGFFGTVGDGKRRTLICIADTTMCYTLYQMKSTYTAIMVLAIVALAAVAGTLLYERAPSELDIFAQCLGEKGASFYGAFWCPHCQTQKKMFGKSAKLLPYVECSTQDGRGQLPACTEQKIEGYPTWEFADGSRLTGEVSLKTLAEKTLCNLPQ